MKAGDFQQLQANLKGAVGYTTPEGAQVDPDAYRAYCLAICREYVRLGVIGGTWAAMRNTIALSACTPVAHHCASWELEPCPGSDTFVGSDQATSAMCPRCYQSVAVKGRFRVGHKRPAHGEG